MIRRISNLAALVSIALAPSISPCVAQKREMQGATVACGSAEVATVADSVAAALSNTPMKLTVACGARSLSASRY